MLPKKPQVLALLLAGPLMIACMANRTCPAGSFQRDPACEPDSPQQADGGVCTVQKTIEGHLEQAAIMFVLDRSSSMRGIKWSAATQAIVGSLGDPQFNTSTVGFYSAPSGTLDGPMCLGAIKVACDAPTWPQIALQAVGTDGTQEIGSLRWQVQNWLASHEPDTGVGDATPLYAAIRNASDALFTWKPSIGTGRRIMIIITDGTANCASVNGGTKYKGLLDCNGCFDWEDPRNIIEVLQANNQNPRKPIESFVIGAPGSELYDPAGCTAPKYHTLLALSAMAAVGSPNNIAADCDGRKFDLMGDNPKKPCHFDLSTAAFNVDALENAIGAVRGKLLSCELDLPKPWEGTMLDRDHVNVEYTLNGKKVPVTKRKNKSSDCLDKGCWDYTPDDRVQLIGKACDDVRSAPGVKVSIQVGCNTIIGERGSSPKSVGRG